MPFVKVSCSTPNALVACKTTPIDDYYIETTGSLKTPDEEGNYWYWYPSGSTIYAKAGMRVIQNESEVFITSEEASVQMESSYPKLKFPIPQCQLDRDENYYFHLTNSCAEEYINFIRSYVMKYSPYTDGPFDETLNIIPSGFKLCLYTNDYNSPLYTTDTIGTGSHYYLDPQSIINIDRNEVTSWGTTSINVRAIPDDCGDWAEISDPFILNF